MKKYTIIILALVLALATLCACGGGNNAPAPTEAPEAEATEIPTVTAPPEDKEAGNIVSADDNAAPDRKTAGDGLADMGEQQKHVEDLVGEPVQSLYDYMGQPKSAEYVTSCAVLGAEDGTLVYDDFYVTTLRFSESEEYIVATGN